MTYELRLPDLGEGLVEGEIARWLVSEGQEIAEDDPLVEIQTDKTTVEIPSPAAGVVARILVAEGTIVPVGTVLVVIGGAAGDGGHGAAATPAAAAGASAEPVPEPSPTSASGSEPQAPTRPAGTGRATPLVKRLARDLGVDLASLSGTGPAGRITEDDVRAAAGELVAQSHKPSDGRREPLRGVRRLVAGHMALAHREIPAVTWVEECDFSRVDLKLLVPTVLHACAAALREYPELNARLEGDEIVYLERYDLGVAVQTEAGLVVPVVRGCDTLSIEELRAEVDRLVEAARAGRLTPDELRGSTFTVTSAGKLAGLFQTPLVNHPEVAILSVGRIAQRPVVRDSRIVAAPVGHVAVTFDHRVVDGARAGAFGLAVIRRLESGDQS
jgi:pyruvate dehydrogenase E2 component (dihydrolipoamide acetyltransferase)